MQDKIIAYVIQFSLEQIDEKIRINAKKAFFDTIAAIFSGVHMEQVRHTADALGISLDQEAGLEAPVVVGWGHCGVSLSDAVLLNAVSAHSCEYNDLFFGLPGHPSAVLVPVVLGLGAHLHKSGAQVLEAYLCGLEVLGRVNEALIPEHHERGFHSTGTAGIIGAAMAAGKLLELSESELGHACSLAASAACGLRGNFGYTGNSLNVGNAAVGGLRAAFYAKSGMKGRRELMSLPDGYVAAFGGIREKMERSLATLGKCSVLECPGLMLKKFPTCFSTYQAIEAAMYLVLKEKICPDQIERIECLTSPNHYMSLPMQWADSIYGQRFCIPFCVCWVLNGGKVDMHSFSKLHTEEEALNRMCRKLQYGVDPGQKGERGFGSTQLKLYLKDGRIAEHRSYPSFDERVEGWSMEAVKEKLLQCSIAVLGRSRAETLNNTLESFETTEDISLWMNQYLGGNSQEKNVY